MPAIVTDLSAETLARELESFLAEHPGAAVLEDARVLFDMREARYALSAEHGRCVLQLWSEERNIVRTVSGLDVRKDALRLQVRRFLDRPGRRCCTCWPIAISGLLLPARRFARAI
jgi:hypothetical protein